MNDSSTKKVAILTEDGFEESELTSPKKALEDAGIRVYIISPQKKKVKAWKHDNWGIELPVDVSVNEARAENFDALVLPGGVMNPDKLRTNKAAVQFANAFFEQNKPVAAICHGPQLLIETGRLNGLTMTSYPSLQTDLRNAGAEWQDKEVVYDGALITSRSPKDLDAFNKKILDVLEERENSDGLEYKYSQSMQ